MGKISIDYNLPFMDLSDLETNTIGKREIFYELVIDISVEDLHAPTTLNLEQSIAYSTILNRINYGTSGVFFVDGPCGIRKTYLYLALLATTKSRGMIAIATTTSGVAYSIMPGGRTSHSRFKIPINANESSFCNINKQIGIAELLRKAKLIIWDEAPMAKRWAIEAFDRSLKDIMDTHLVFGGKDIVFGGDFQQVLLVVPQDTKAETINASLVMYYLWPKMENLRATTNMRARFDTIFSDSLLHIGNVDEPTTDEDIIKIPNEMLIKYGDDENPEECLTTTFLYLKIMHTQLNISQTELSLQQQMTMLIC